MMPCTSPPFLQHGAGDLAHHAVAAAAIDQADAVLGEDFAEIAGGLRRRPGWCPGWSRNRRKFGGFCSSFSVLFMGMHVRPACGAVKTTGEIRCGCGGLCPAAGVITGQNPPI